MAKKKKTTRSNESSFLKKVKDGTDTPLYEMVEGNTIKNIGAGLLLIVGLLELLGIFNSAGELGKMVVDSFRAVFGILYTVVWIPLLYIAVSIFRKKSIDSKKSFLFFLLSFSFLAFVSLFETEVPESFSLGGHLGHAISEPLQKLISPLLTGVLTFMGMLSALFFLFGRENALEMYAKIHSLFEGRTMSLPRLPKFFDKDRSEDYDDEADQEVETEEKVELRDELLGRKRDRQARTERPMHDELVEPEEKDIVKDTKRQAQEKPIEQKPRKVLRPSGDFTPPPLSLLQRDSGKPSVGDTKANMAIIKRTLAEFGITVEMDEVSIGPSVTRYTLKPAQGVKLSRIANHRQELAYALRAESIRIEAPIPGKALVGIEIPNYTKATVGLASLLGTDTWKNDERPLLVALGKGISGNALYSNLAKMPHVLIAGTTGSGKSVMVHAIINSLLFRNDPSMLKFIMVDPKKVELTLYNNIPHLYTPVITNAKLAIRTLTWAVNEMERRYDVLEENGERDIGSYHKNIYQKALSKNSDDLPERMPYIVIIIDELADIMMSYPKELEAAIVRLAQKSRAVGIHLILSTQRPSVNVITGLIKANVPSRIALKVASQIDSRTIIDTAGAEQLLGQGDLLFTSSESPKQERVQSAFVSDGEVKRVVQYLRDSYRDEPKDEINVESNPGGNKTMGALFGTDLGSQGDGDTDDDLLEQAQEIVISSKKASTSYLQRRLKVGYSRAARLMDMLEERGVIGPADGAKPREILIAGDDNLTDTSDE